MGIIRKRRLFRFRQQPERTCNDHILPVGTAEELHRTQELLDQFMKANTDIKVKLEGKDWGSYWDGLTANAAGAHFRTCLKRVMHTWRNTPSSAF